MKSVAYALPHLLELRSRLLKALLSLALIFLALLPFMQTLFSLLAKPLLAQLPAGQHLIAVNLPATLLMPLKLVSYTSLFCSVPFICYQLWAFIAPGLYLQEKKIAWVLLGLSVVLFYLGVVFAYGVVFPLMFHFFIQVAPVGVSPTPDVGAYLQFCLHLFLAFGLAFEVPVVVLAVVALDWVSLETLRQLRPYLITVAFIVGMLLTPPDVLSQVLLAVPICLLFELGLLGARLLLPQRTAKKRE